MKVTDRVSISEERLELLKRTRNWKEDLKDLLDVETDLDEDEIIITGDPMQILKAKEIIKAFGRGFNFKDTLYLLDEEYFLEIVNAGEFTGKSRKRQVELRGRVIGEDGTTKRMIEKYAEVKIAIHGKTVSIIGKPNNIRIAKNAVEMILSGSKHNSAYRFLQENRVV